MPAFSFSPITRIIEVAAPDTEVTVQELVNAIRDWEDDLDNMDTPSLAVASGKEDLGGGLQVGITLKLLSWKVKFEDRLGPEYADCGVSGGNLVATDADGQPMNPIAPAAFVSVTKSTAVSAALIEDVAEWTQSEKDGIFTRVESTKDKVLVVKAAINDMKSKPSVPGSFDPETDSLEAIRNRGDVAWKTGRAGRHFSL